MNDQKNGQAPAQPLANQGIVDQITQTMRPAMQCTMRGLVTGYPGVPAHIILSMIAFEAGLFTGQAIQADITTMVQLRQMFRKSFDDGIAKAPLVQPGQADWQPPEGQKIIGS